MKVILFTHPSFLNSTSMPRFAALIFNMLASNAVNYEVWTAKPYLHNLCKNKSLSKWLGYIDQFIVFPLTVKYRLRAIERDALFIFCDQALGPWVPLVADRPHVIHCHDLLALKSAIGLVPANPTSFSGELYQKFIRRGFGKGRNFIPISHQTKRDLLEYGNVEPEICNVVYNCLNYPYTRVDRIEAFDVLQQSSILTKDTGCFLHIGGGQWYKNTAGVIALYNAYCRKVKKAKPLIMVSPPHNKKIQSALRMTPGNGSIKFHQGLPVQTIEALYSYADLFLFPSLAEGFGWPIIEAQACGCPVLTTDDAPMNEISGPVALLLPNLVKENKEQWAEEGSDKLLDFLNCGPATKEKRVSQAIEWSKNFAEETIKQQYLKIYMQVLANHEGAN
jgi:glycosyltransferase involved in cell wall biosynthesis